jgi:hypothetical protein
LEDIEEDSIRTVLERAFMVVRKVDASFIRVTWYFFAACVGC